MKKIRLKSVCLLNPLPNKKFQNLHGTFLPMEKVQVGHFELDASLPYNDIATGYTFMENNDVIRAIVTPCFENDKGALLKDLKNGFAFGSTEFMCIRPKKINSKFLYYVASSIGFKNYAITSMKGVGGLRRINSKFALTYQIDDINISQQRTIANFLDHQTSKIDKEISLLENKVELLDELNQATIYEVVTKGLNPNAKMKDSYINLVGLIPEHWNVKRVKDISSTLSKSAIPSGDSDIDGAYDFYVSGSKVKKSHIFNLQRSALLFPTGGTYMVHRPKEVPCAYSTDVLPVVTKDNHLKLDFMFYFFISNPSYFNQIYFAGTGLKHLQRSELFNSLIPIPPENEQNDISEYLNTFTESIKNKQKLINKKISLLKEYKQSLIYEAVTGKTNIEEIK